MCILMKFITSICLKNSTLFIPHNYTHGFQVLSSKADLLYLFDDTFKIKSQ